MFQSQGRFFGGCCQPDWGGVGRPGVVSIAGAILWGVLRNTTTTHHFNATRFNRRGDSLGGAAAARHGCASGDTTRFNRRGDSLGGAASRPVRRKSAQKVSIAGAILWGVLPKGATAPSVQEMSFNRRGDSLGGAARRRGWASSRSPWFQSQGRFFGGCCAPDGKLYVSPEMFQSQGRFFGGCCSDLAQKTIVALKFQSQGRFFGGCCGP